MGEVSTTLTLMFKKEKKYSKTGVQYSFGLNGHYINFLGADILFLLTLDI